MVGDRHDSNTDFGSADKLSDCFFLPALLGVLLDARNNLFRRSINVGGSFSRGGLPVFCGSDCASGSVVPVRSSLPELSFFQSLALSEELKESGFFYEESGIQDGIYLRSRAQSIIRGKIKRILLV